MQQKNQCSRTRTERFANKKKLQIYVKTEKKKKTILVLRLLEISTIKTMQMVLRNLKQYVEMQLTRLQEKQKKNLFADQVLCLTQSP